MRESETREIVECYVFIDIHTIHLEVSTELYSPFACVVCDVRFYVDGFLDGTCVCFLSYNLPVYVP